MSKKFSELDRAVSLNNGDLLALAQVDEQAETGYKSAAAPMSDVAQKILKNTSFPTDLNTENKTPIGAINEVDENVGTISEKVNNTISTGNIPVYDILKPTLTNTNGAILDTGALRTDFTTFQYSQKIPVQEGDYITPISSNGGAYFRWVCAYDENDNPIQAKGAVSVTSYSVPEGIVNIVVTTPVSHNVSSINILRQTDSFERDFVIPQNLGKTNWTGDLDSGDEVDLLWNNVRFNTVWVFTGHVSTLGKITFGVKDKTGNINELCSVDGTYIYYKQQNGTMTTEAHGLTISQDIMIRVESPYKVNQLGSIRICSDGTEYILSANAWGIDIKGTPCVISAGAVLTDCAFSWIPKDIDKPIWVFGDSWCSYFTSRWPYHMNEAGYSDSWMLNFYAGESTTDAFISLISLLSIRTPQYIVWTLGMNDGDGNLYVNPAWKTVYDKLSALCEQLSINLILYTVPNTPTINNNFKNAIVRASGYRYIDCAAAMGDDGNGNWFTGYEQSASDHNHPSEKGALALFYRILADFPEIASKC